MKSDIDPVQARSEFGTLEELECRGRLVFLRTDPSIAPVAEVALPPEDQSSEEAEVDSRYVGTGACAATLRRLLQLQARVIIATHLPNEPERNEGLRTMEQLGMRLSEQQKVEVLLPDDCLGDAVKMVTNELRDGQVCVLPDLRTHEGEASNDEAFARALSSYCDSFVCDSFATSHEVLASQVRMPRLCARRALGLNARRELSAVNAWTMRGRAPRTLVVGGSKLADKVELLDFLLPSLHVLQPVGGIASTFLAATGKCLGTTVIESDILARARSFLLRARDLGVAVELPTDLQVEHRGQASACSSDEVPDEARIVGLGPQTLESLARGTSNRRLLLWGPAGDLATDLGRSATADVLQAVRSIRGSKWVLGDSLRAFMLNDPAKLCQNIDWVFTGSQATKQALKQGSLPALDAVKATS